ncbi:MAG: type I-B CRISPR-associated protein Cas7/Cst2/DevR [Turicibacter sp.]|nr:type I-B CRISPR-associated protein Cas7/Cst2/DevR [Turicibacter sp.]
MKQSKGLTLTVVCLVQSANYGEGLGNVSVLKKFTRNDSNQYTYISRQALRYSLVEQLQWNNTPVEVDKKVVQFAPTATIADYPEIDLFGYMKTISKTEDSKGGAKTRAAVVRLSDAISLEPYTGDYDFLTNMGLAKRIGESNSLAQSEQHLSYYTYTLTLDLSRIGIDENDSIEISNDEKANRVIQLLEAVEFLNRDIRGREESFNPVFVIGGVYDRKNPFFKDRIQVKGNELGFNSVKEIKESYTWLNEQTRVGVVSGMFKNDEAIKCELGATQISDVFKAIKAEVRDYYAN